MIAKIATFAKSKGYDDYQTNRTPKPFSKSERKHWFFTIWKSSENKIRHIQLQPKSTMKTSWQQLTASNSSINLHQSTLRGTHNTSK